jgi:pimeloyl-ACP methyl ester carboxylesterase
VNATAFSHHTIELAAGARVAFSETGDGPVIVCLPNGLPGSTARDDFAANLDALRHGHRLVLMDLPSPSSPTSEAESADTLTHLLGNALERLQIERATLIGNGLGGEIALRLAASAPQRVDKLVLIAPWGCRYSVFTPPPMEGLKAIVKYWEAPSTERMAAMLRLLSTNADLTSDTEVERRQAEAMKHADRGEFQRSIAAELRDVLPLAPLVQAPMLIIWGREDRFGPLDHGLNLLPRIPEARFHMVPRCGHWAQREQAAEINTVVRDFLGGAA